MLYGFFLVYQMDLYLPWQVRLMRAVKVTFLGHLGLWLGTLEIRGWPRLLVAALMIPSIAGVFFLWWEIHFFLAVSVLFGMGWLLFRVTKGAGLDD
jgi:hypothetical protein